MALKEKIQSFMSKYLLLILTASAAVVAWSRLVQIQMLFLGSLYYEMNILRLDALIRNYLIKKLIIATILIILGASSTALYYFSHTRKRFRNLGILCFVSAVFIYSMFEPETLFRVPREHLLFWLKTEKVSTACFYMAFTVTVYHFVDLKRAGEIKKLTALFTAAVSIFAMALPTAPGNKALIAFLIYMLAVLSFFLYIFLRQHRIGKYMPVFAATIAAMLMDLILIRYKLDAQTGSGRAYALIPYAVVVWNIALYIMMVWRHNIRIQYVQDKEQHAEEIRRDKEIFRNAIGRRLEISIGSMRNIADSIAEDNQIHGRKNSKELLLLKGEIESMEKALSEYLRSDDANTMALRFVELSVNNAIASAISPIHINDEMREIHAELHIENEIGEILGDPFYLTKTFHEIFRQLARLSEGAKIYIGACRKGGTVLITAGISRQIMPLKELNHYMSGKGYLASRASDGELGTAIEELKEIIKVHSGNIWTREDGRYTNIVCSLPLLSGERSTEEKKESTEPVTKREQNWSRVVIVSSVQEQGDLLSLYLEDSAFETVIIRDGERALEYIKKNRFINLVILGSLLKGIDRVEFSKRLRSLYSWSSLPLLVLLPEWKENSSDAFFSLANAYLTEPYDRRELLVIIRSLQMMKKSVDDAVRTQLDLLQSQMNPHFVFNTLSAVMGLCIKEPVKAHALLGDFSDYLRATLFANNESKRIPIWKEVDHINAYLSIIRARFGELIQSETKIECDEDCLIVPLIIEPIVENCVVHAFQGDRKLTIWISLKEEQEMLHVAVKDDGKGMDDQKVQEILTSMGQSRSFGLITLRKRLMMEYGQQLEIRSTEGEGTLVEYRLPIQKDPDRMIRT